LLARLLAHSLTPWTRVLQKLTSSQLVKNLPAYYRTRRFITALTSARHLSLSSPARSSTHPHIPLPQDPAYYYPPIHAWVSQVVSFPQVSPPKLCIHLSSPPYALHASLNSFFPILSPEQYCKRITPLILNLYTSWKRDVNVTPRERTTLSSGQDTARHREGLEVLERTEISVPTGIRSLDRPVRSLVAIPTTVRGLECPKERMVY